MTFTRDTHVADIAAAVPSSVRVFQRYGIDFCCGGRKPLGEVCSERRVAYEELASAIVASTTDRTPEERDWTTAPLKDLADHIEAAYHTRLREDLPRLERMAAKVADVHGRRASQALVRIHELVEELSEDLHDHMLKEERILFPAIRAIEAHGASFAIGAPVEVMEQEHDRAGALLAELRIRTDGYVPPDWACQTYRSLFHGLEELEREMHMHVHLENNILFRRALELAATAGAAQP
jgi:regulator of cell morphogenesis and NO signaling